jgi:serine/threonine-protein kinase
MATGSGNQASAQLLHGSSRYELLGKIASGGMATVFAGRLRGAEGFYRLVAIKRAHPHLLEDPAFRRMLLEEARLASRLHHPNIVAVQDVEELSGELLLIMDYIEGTSLADLLWGDDAEGRPLHARAAVRIALDACAGLQAVHDLRDERGEPMHLVHRDISPHNLLIGVDGVARVADFGIARCKQTQRSTSTGALKGKVAYMAPEYIEGGNVDARSDLFGLGVVVWESLARQRLFRGENEIDTLKRVVSAEAPLLSSVAPWLGRRLDSVVARALEKRPEDRYPSVEAFGNALESIARRDDLIAAASEVGAQVRAAAAPQIDRRRAVIRDQLALSDGAAGPEADTRDLARPAAQVDVASTPAPRPSTPEPTFTNTHATAPGVSSVSAIGLLEASSAAARKQRTTRVGLGLAAGLLLLVGGGLGVWIRPGSSAGNDARPVVGVEPPIAPSASASSAPSPPAPIVAPLIPTLPLSASATSAVAAPSSAPRPAVSGARPAPARSGVTPKAEPLPPNPYGHSG